MALGTAITFARLDALFTLMAADAWLADPEAAGAAAFNDVLLKAVENIDLLDRVAAQIPLPTAPAAALPVVDAPAQALAVAGEETQIPIQVLNAGGQPFSGARLALEAEGETVVDMALPDLAPGQMTRQLLAYTPPEPGRVRMTARVVVDDRSDTRILMLVAQPPAKVVDKSNPVADNSLVEENDSTTSLTAARPILLGVMAVSGIVFLLSLGALLLRGRRKP